MSVNKAWQGRRYKTKAYQAYEEECLDKLPNNLKVGKGKLWLMITVGFSNKQSDLDNICKPFLDILQKKYEFDDNQIYRLYMHKAVVKKGCEFISFQIEELEEEL